jgi:hypothetical protein
MTHADAMKRLAGCRAAQPGLGQILVASEVVDALLAPPPMVCVYCGLPRGDGHSWRCSVTKNGVREHWCKDERDDDLPTTVGA